MIKGKVQQHKVHFTCFTCPNGWFCKFRLRLLYIDSLSKIDIICYKFIYERILYRTCEDKESDMHAFIKQLQSTKLNDLSNRISNSEIGNKVANTRLSKAADAREEAKLNQMKKTRSNPDITPCYQCGKRAVYSAECGCRLHSGTVGFRSTDSWILLVSKMLKPV